LWWRAPRTYAQNVERDFVRVNSGPGLAIVVTDSAETYLANQPESCPEPPEQE
jgi:hypothetical protein